MKRIGKLVLVLFGLLALSSAAFAQTVLTQTTLAAEVTVGTSGASSGLGQTIFATEVDLASATGVNQAFNGQPETLLYVDNEVMGVLTLLPGTTTWYTVLRGQMGTKAASHAAKAVVYIQTASPQFGGGSGSGGLQDADPPQGECIAASTLYSPWINVHTSKQWICAAQLTPGGTSITQWQPASADDFYNQNAPQTAYTTVATYSNATTTASNIPGIAFPVQANRNYQVDCDVTRHASASTAGADYTWTGPASPTYVTQSALDTVTSTTFLTASAVGTSFAAAPALANGGTVTTTTNFTDHVHLTLQNGANAGTVQLQANADGSGTLTVVGASCRMQ